MTNFTDEKVPPHPDVSEDAAGLSTSDQPGNAALYTRLSTLKPTTLALLVQCVALLLTMALVCLIRPIIAFEINLLAFLFMQSSMALCLTVWLAMPPWWRVIQFSFPLAIWLMQGLHIPAGFYLLGFLISLSLYWTTFRTQVPFYPSRLPVWRQLTGFIAPERSIRMIDIGSGLGDLTMYMADARSNSQFYGIEIAPLPWLISVVRARLRHSAARFKLGDYRKLDFADYDIVFAYLSPAAMPMLWQKARREMSAGSLLISYEFAIADSTPTILLSGDDHSAAIYIWQM